MNHSENYQSKRRLRRFFSSEPIPQVGGFVQLPEGESHHLRDILRLQEGDSCLLMDGKGRIATAHIIEYSASNAKLKIMEIQVMKKEERTWRIFAYVAIPQRGKFDILVEKAQELGIERICPLETARTIVKMSPDNKAKTLKRWQKIACEAAKQSGSSELLQINAQTPFENVFETISPEDQILIFHPGPESETLGQVLDSFQAKSFQGNKALHFFIGPEGGFTEEEASVARSKGARQVTLGETLLKVDTAFIGVASALKFMFL